MSLIEPMSISEAAKRLGVSRQRAWRLVREGRIEAERSGYLWIVEGLGLNRALIGTSGVRGKGKKNPARYCD